MTQIYDWATEQLHESSTDTVLSTTLLLRWVNEGLGEVATAAKWKWLEGQVELTFGGHGAGANTSVGITYLPHHVQQVESIWPSGLTYRSGLEIIGAWEMDMLGPTATGGIPNFLAVWGYYSVARDNPSIGTIVATDTLGSAAQVVVEGIDNNGREASETGIMVAGTYTTATQFAAGPDGVRRCYVAQPAAAAGVVTFTRGATVLETLNVAQGEFIKERLRTELSPPPTTGTADYIIRFYKRIRPVRRLIDIVDIPFEFENLLFHAIDRRLSLFRGEMPHAAYHEQAFRARVRELKGWQNRQGGRMRGQTRIARGGYW